MKGIFKKFGKRAIGFVAIVSSLPRSSTSMMLEMYATCGISPITDNIPPPRRTTLRASKSKKMPDGDTAWVSDTQGKPVKVIAALLEYLPEGYTYKILFMRCNMDDFSVSQKQILICSDNPIGQISEEKLVELYSRHIANVIGWMSQQPN